MTSIESNSKILTCKAALHFESTGCPTCGVVHIGSSTNLQQFVKRIHRQTGLETLVSLPFEMQALEEERLEALHNIGKSSLILIFYQKFNISLFVLASLSSTRLKIGRKCEAA